MVICDPTPDAIVKRFMELIVNPDLLKSIVTRGQIISQKIFDPRKQLGQRSTLLGKAIKHNEVQWAINLVARYKANIQAIVDQARHIHNLEITLMKYHNSLYGKCLSFMSRLYSFMRSK